MIMDLRFKRVGTKDIDVSDGKTIDITNIYLYSYRVIIGSK